MSLLLKYEQFWHGEVSERIEAPITPELLEEIKAYCRKHGLKRAQFGRLSLKLAMMVLIANKDHTAIHLSKEQLEDLISLSSDI